MPQKPSPLFSFLPEEIDPKYYDLHLEEKCTFFEQLFSGFTVPKIDRFASPATGYRMRAEFRIWHQEDAIHYAMMSPGKEKSPRMIAEFLPASPRIQQAMPVLLAALAQNTLLKTQLFQLEFLSSMKGELLVTLIYHRPLDEAWMEQARQLKQQLSGTLGTIDFVGRSRRQKLCVDRDFIYEQLNVAGIVYSYQQIEGSFTQPNAAINQKMLDWSTSATKNIGGDLLELYCGNANFTLPLSKNFSKVLATEVSKTSIQAATHNASINNINNIAIARLSSEEVAQAITRIRPFKRLANIDLDSYHFSTTLVDPPRAGLDQQTLELVSSFDNICYISCNPETLAANLQSLVKTHSIIHMAFFDQFPYTHHMECGVLLSRRSG